MYFFKNLLRVEKELNMTLMYGCKKKEKKNSKDSYPKEKAPQGD